MSDLNPITRREVFLAAAGGQDVTTPTPITREEVFLDAIANSGGGGGGSSGGGVLVVHLDENGTLDKTWKEIHDADFAVLKILSIDGGVMFGYIGNVGISDPDGSYYVSAGTPVSPFTYFDAVMFSTDSENGYPAFNSN